MLGGIFNPGIAINPVLIGDNGNNVLTGTGANNTLIGLGGNDRLNGMAGADELYGDLGADTLNGGSGQDLLLGGDGNDWLLGGNGNDVLEGGNGNDVLEGGNGNDVLEGGNGNDVLEGGNGNDILEGGNGNDILVGELGNDVLVGGLGNDTIYLGAGSDIVVLAADSGHDTLEDFEDGQDKIHIEGGLTFDDLNILSLGASDTVIVINKAGDPSDGEKLATLIGVIPNQLTEDDFIFDNIAPTITSSSTVTVRENRTSAINIETSDDSDSEGSGLTYSISGGADAALFSIDTENGVVTFNNAPDFEAPEDANDDNVYKIEVTVADSAGLTDTQTVTVNVRNILNEPTDLDIFLSNNSTVDFRTANLISTATIQSFDWHVSGDDKDALLLEIKAYQRLLRLLPSDASDDFAVALLKSGFSSALQIASLTESEFVQQASISIFRGDEALTKSVYERALAMRNTILLQYTASRT